MKKVLITITLLVLAMVCFPKMVNAKTNKQVVRNYVNTHYGKNWKIKYVPWTSPIIDHRTDYAKKKVIIVDVVKSKSTGKKDKRNNRYYGKILGSRYRCWYNKKVVKGKMVTQYAIYNPYNNECDDVMAVVDNGMIR